MLEVFRGLTDEELRKQVVLLAASERNATGLLIASLAEADARQLHRGQGFSSLYVYCMEVLHLSECEAYARITAARAARRFPVVLDLLNDGSLTLTNLTRLASHLTESNHLALLHAARYKTRREVQQLITSLDPSAVPLITIVLHVPPATHDKFLEARDLLRHVLPTGDAADIFDRALTMLVSSLRRQKGIADVGRPRKTAQLKLTSRHVPAAVRRRVWRRDEGRCAFVGPMGRCPETGFLEFHHVVPFARGGKPLVENIQLRCRSHNQYESEREFAPPNPVGQSGESLVTGSPPAVRRRRRVPGGPESDPGRTAGQPAEAR
jgi:hypothetical protein